MFQKYKIFFEVYKFFEVFLFGLPIQYILILFLCIMKIAVFMKGCVYFAS